MPLIAFMPFSDDTQLARAASCFKPNKLTQPSEQPGVRLLAVHKLSRNLKFNRRRFTGQVTHKIVPDPANIVGLI